MEVGMAELAERVARLEERFDGVAVAIADLKQAVNKLDAHMEAGFAEVRNEFRVEFCSIRTDSTEMRAEMNTQFRWIMGSIGSAALAILVAVLAAVLSRG
jgi:hypothetical protein